MVRDLGRVCRGMGKGYRQPKRMTSEITSYTRKYVRTLLISSTEYLMVLQKQ